MRQRGVERHGQQRRRSGGGEGGAGHDDGRAAEDGGDAEEGGGRAAERAWVVGRSAHDAPPVPPRVRSGAGAAGSRRFSSAAGRGRRRAGGRDRTGSARGCPRAGRAGGTRTGRGWWSRGRRRSSAARCSWVSGSVRRTRPSSPRWPKRSPRRTRVRARRAATGRSASSSAWRSRATYASAAQGQRRSACSRVPRFERAHDDGGAQGLGGVAVGPRAGRPGADEVAGTRHAHDAFATRGKRQRQLDQAHRRARTRSLTGSPCPVQRLAATQRARHGGGAPGQRQRRRGSAGTSARWHRAA
jgi:hypothetical protein